jgi:hypothetical protein
MDSLTFREIIAQAESGQIRIPAFQRGFVWEPERVAQFIDSLYKGYPFGALLFWRASEQLRVEKHLGPFALPDPRDDYPIDYVLDGQQRVTSVYGTFQTTHLLADEEGWKEIYFDYALPDDVQEPQFFALAHDEVDPERHFPLRVLFDTTAYRRKTRDFNDALAARIDSMQARFKEARLPVQMFRTEDKGTVAVIFERINRQGVPLDTLQLLSAWTWSEDFQLQAQFEELIDELESKGFVTTAFDENLLLRCASAILVTNPRPEAIVTIPGEQIRNKFDEVLNGILGTLDFLEMNLNLRRIDNLPFQTILVPLSAFFAISGNREVIVSDKQRQLLLKWFWRVSFARRYSSGVIRHLEDDIKGMLQLKGGQQSNLANFSADISDDFFLGNSFGIRNVNTKTFVLLLAHQSPKSFVSGIPIDLNEKLKAYNKAEFHHLMPKAYVDSLPDKESSVNCLANYCFLSRSENKHLGGVRPSEYRRKMSDRIDDILSSAVCPQSLFTDQFDTFVRERAAALKEVATSLLG